MNPIEWLNAVAQTWIDFMWIRSIDAAWVFLIVGLIWFLTRNRVHAQFGYWLFMLVIIKLFIPFQQPVAIPNLLSLYDLTSQKISITDTPIISDKFNAIDAKVSLSLDAAALEDAAPVLSKHLPLIQLPLKTILMLGWAIISLILFVRFAYSEWRTAVSVKQSPTVDLNQLPVSFQQLKATARVHRPVRLATNQWVSSPIVYGITSPVLLIPNDMSQKYTTNQISWILLHELAHIKRYDALARLVQKIARNLFFFHPVIWFTNWMLDRQREFACDDSATIHADIPRRDCGEGFLNVVFQVNSARLPATGLLGLFNSKQIVKERLMRILDHNHSYKARLTISSIVLLTALTLLIVPFSGAMKQTKKSEAHSNNSLVNDKTDLLIQSIDSSINAINIKATLIQTRNKIFANQSEQKKADFVNNRRENFRRKRPGDADKIIPYKAKTFEHDPVYNINLDITSLNNKTRIMYDLENDWEDSIVFYEPGKRFDISNRELNTDKKMVTVEDHHGAIDSFHLSTPHTFGRGLSFYLGHPKQMTATGKNTSLLTIFSPSGEKEKIAEFNLDSTKGNCWTDGRIFTKDGKIHTEIHAKDFKKNDIANFPYHVEIITYYEGEFTLKQEISIEEITALPGDHKELNVFNDIPPDAIFPRSL